MACRFNASLTADDHDMRAKAELVSKQMDLAVESLVGYSPRDWTLPTQNEPFYDSVQSSSREKAILAHAISGERFRVAIDVITHQSFLTLLPTWNMVNPIANPAGADHTMCYVCSSRPTPRPTIQIIASWG
eukprot:29717-Chlamydomonas_euryale.AAC.9